MQFNKTLLISSLLLSGTTLNAEAAQVGFE